MEINFMCCVSDSSHFFKVLPRDPLGYPYLRILDLLEILYPQHAFSSLELNLNLYFRQWVMTMSTCSQLIFCVLTTCSCLFAERQNHHLYYGWLQLLTRIRNQETKSCRRPPVRTSFLAVKIEFWWLLRNPGLCRVEQRDWGQVSLRLQRQLAQYQRGRAPPSTLSCLESGEEIDVI